MRSSIVLLFLLVIPTVALAQHQTGDSGFSMEAAKPVHPLPAIEPGCWAALGINTLYDVRYVPEPGGKHIKNILTSISDPPLSPLFFNINKVIFLNDPESFFNH